jgi:hypothetical protein
MATTASIKKRQVMAYDFPHNLQVETQIVVSQAVSHASHRRPGDVWILRQQIRWKLLQGGPDEFEIVHNAIL